MTKEKNGDINRETSGREGWFGAVGIESRIWWEG